MMLRRRRRPAGEAAQAFHEADWPGRRTPWREAEYCVVDFETTGLDPRHDEIVSFGAVPIREGRVWIRGVRSGLVRPARMPGAETILIHGLRPADLADAPPLSSAIDELLRALTGRVLIAHVARIEIGFLRPALRDAGLRLPRRSIDTAALARHVVKGDANQVMSLTALAEHLGLPVHRRHHAEGDALTTAQVFLVLAGRLDRARPQTVGSLVAASRAPRGIPVAAARRSGRIVGESREMRDNRSYE
jgi:DNA polymerase III subunit epsilon